MSRVARSDWAALVSWKNVQDKPSFLEGPDGEITISDVRGLQQALDSKQSKDGLARVAYTGNYNDLNNKPAFGSAAFANTTDFMPARTPRRWQMAEFTFTAGFQIYDVLFSEEMSDVPTVKCQILMADGSGEMFFAVVQKDLITTTGFRVFISGIPAATVGSLRWWAEVETSFGGSAAPVAPYEPETLTWIAGVDAAGGTYESDSQIIANNLVVALKATVYYSKIVYLLPLLGGNLAAARMPLIDTLAVGIATSTAFVNGDFSQATGLQGNGTTKYLDSLIKPSQLGTTNNGGIGFIENNITLAGNSEPIGCYNTAGSQRFVLDLRSTRRFMSWGDPANIANENVAASNANYYAGRSSSTDRRLFRNGVKLATNTTIDTASGASDRTIIIVGCDESSSILPYPGRCACAYMTNGTLSDADVADFNTLLGTYLITPTGRP